MVLTVITVVLLCVVCFIGGMLVELFINSDELQATRSKLMDAQAELAALKQPQEDVVEVIEITDLTATATPKDKIENLFETW